MSRFDKCVHCPVLEKRMEGTGKTISLSDKLEANLFTSRGDTAMFKGMCQSNQHKQPQSYMNIMKPSGFESPNPQTMLTSAVATQWCFYHWEHFSKVSSDTPLDAAWVSSIIPFQALLLHKAIGTMTKVMHSCQWGFVGWDMEPLPGRRWAMKAQPVCKIAYRF